VASKYRLSVAPLGAADALSQYVAYDQAIGANANAVHGAIVYLAATDVVRCYATDATISFTFNGVKDAL
jgi:hypothetical protein